MVLEAVVKINSLVQRQHWKRTIVLSMYNWFTIDVCTLYHWQSKSLTGITVYLITYLIILEMYNYAQGGSLSCDSIMCPAHTNPSLLPNNDLVFCKASCEVGITHYLFCTFLVQPFLEGVSLVQMYTAIVWKDDINYHGDNLVLGVLIAPRLHS